MALRLKYEEPEAGQWVAPIRRGYKSVCCDCGLVHDMDFRIVTDSAGRKQIQFRVFAAPRSTAAIRRHMRGRKR